MDDETLKIFAYVSISSYRAKSLKALMDGKKTPTNIAKDSGIRLNHISNVLRELKEQDLVVCLNEDQKKYRYYELTELGEEIAEHLD